MATLTTSYQLIASKHIGTVSGSGVSAKDIYLRIYAKYNSQSIADNKSKVSYKSTLYVEGSGTYFYTGSTTTKTLGGTGATSVSADAQGNYNLGETTLNEIAGTVTHGSNGAASVSITAGWASAPWGISGSLTGTADLPPIARATTPTLAANTITMGASINITLTPANSTFKHKLRYDFGAIKGSASGFSVGAEYTAQGNTTVAFTPPTSLGNQIPNNSSGTGQIICYTYTSSGTHIGTTYVKITLNIPSYVPTISGITLTGDKLLSSTYVQGKSSVTVSATTSTSYGASIKSITSVIDGKTYSGLPFTTSALSSGSKTATITVVDTRNKSATLTSNAIQVYAYSTPNITEFTLARQSDGTTVIATIKGSISAVNNKNAKTIKVTLNGVTNTITSSSYTISGTTTFTGVSTDKTFTAKAVLTDSYTSVSRESALPTVAVTMDFYKDGNGIAMGKVAEEGDLLDVSWKAKFRKILSVISDTFDALTITRTAAGSAATINFRNGNGSLGYIGMSGTANLGLTRWSADGQLGYSFLDTGNTKDHVVEQGTNGIWTYEKWNSGKVICWGNVSTTPTTVNGNNAISVSLPLTFVGTDYKVDITPAKAAMYVDAFGDCATNGNITHTTTNFTMSYKYSYGTAYAVSFNVTVRGKWK